MINKRHEYALVDTFMGISIPVGSSSKLSVLEGYLKKDICKDAHVEYLGQRESDSYGLWAVILGASCDWVPFDSILLDKYKNAVFLRDLDLYDNDRSLELHTGVVVSVDGVASYECRLQRDDKFLFYVWDKEDISYFYSEYTDSTTEAFTQVLTMRSPRIEDVSQESMYEIQDRLNKIYSQSERRNYLLWLELNNKIKKENDK